MTNEVTSTTTDAERGQVTSTAAEVYESFFVPALFGQWPARVLARAGVALGHRVLDLGCGTGILARAARHLVGPEGSVIGVDPNEGMLAVARRADPDVTWRSGRAEALPLPDEEVDHVICQFAAMFFTDRAAAAAEAARVAADGGRITFATWSGLEHSPGYAAMVALVERELGSTAADALRAPFALGSAAQVAELLEPVTTEVEVVELEGTARFESIDAWVRTDIRGWTLADLVDDEGEATLAAAARRDLAGFVADDGQVAFPAPALVGTGTVRR